MNAHVLTKNEIAALLGQRRVDSDLVIIWRTRRPWSRG